MLADLTDELDAMLQLERKGVMMAFSLSHDPKYPHPVPREKNTFVLSKSFTRSWKD
jgi:hypothetical protein